MKKLLLSLLIVFVLNVSCGHYARSTAPLLIDCLTQDQTKLDALATEISPLINGDMPNWRLFQKRSIAAGVYVGGCTAAKLIQKYLAPSPGNSAPPPDKGWAAHNSFEEVRAEFNKAQFKTELGIL